MLKLVEGLVIGPDNHVVQHNAGQYYCVSKGLILDCTETESVMTHDNICTKIDAKRLKQRDRLSSREREEMASRENLNSEIKTRVEPHSKISSSNRDTSTRDFLIEARYRYRPVQISLTERGKLTTPLVILVPMRYRPKPISLSEQRLLTFHLR